MEFSADNKARFDRILAPDDEVALLPPVAGGAGTAKITTGVRTEAVPMDEVMELVADPGAGGTVVFVGTVREQSEGWGEVDQLSYSIYREMAEPMLRKVAEEAADPEAQRRRLRRDRRDASHVPKG